ncbi:hypothetical protein AMECASPLE_032811 [Ameca splendens]|uniref:Uncharacterized protein n=1 Tax=Ameca splendens TaxID=208324 RepID=A0ABV0ZS57_9TELE
MWFCSLRDILTFGTVKSPLGICSVTGGLPARTPCSVRLSGCVLVQDTSPTLSADGGQRAWWCQLYGRLTSVSVAQGSCGYNVAHQCQCVSVWMNGWKDDCSALGSSDLIKALCKCRPFTLL